MSNKHLGSSFEDFLKEEGDFAEVSAVAVKRVLAWQLREAMEEQNLSKQKMAAKMKTSRAQLDRVLDPENDRVQLDTVMKAAAAVGRKVQIQLA